MARIEYGGKTPINLAEAVGRGVIERFGPDTISHWPLIAGSVFPSILQDERYTKFQRLPLTLQSHDDAARRGRVPRSMNPEAYSQFAENFNEWDRLLKMLGADSQKRLERFDSIMPEIVDMQIAPTIVGTSTEPAGYGAPILLVQLEVHGISHQRHVEVVEPFLQSLNFEAARRILVQAPDGTVNKPYVVNFNNLALVF